MRATSPSAAAAMCRFFSFALLVSAIILARPEAAAADDGGFREVGRIKSKSLAEISGIAASRQNPGILWMHNDGDSRHVYAVKTSGKVVAQLIVRGSMEDVEDIAIGPCPQEGIDYLYLGDIGDNQGKRREIRVVRVAEPSLEGVDGQPRPPTTEELRLTYPDGPHDAEALMIDPLSGDLFIATKENRQTRVYVARAQDVQAEGSARLDLVTTLTVEQVSAGDISPDGSLIVLRRENQGWLWNRASGESLAAALAREPQKIRVRGKNQGENGEAIAFDPQGPGYYTVSEGKNERIYAFELSSPGAR